MEPALEIENSTPPLPYVLMSLPPFIPHCTFPLCCQFPANGPTRLVILVALISPYTTELFAATPPIKHANFPLKFASCALEIKLTVVSVCPILNVSFPSASATASNIGVIMTENGIDKVNTKSLGYSGGLSELVPVSFSTIVRVGASCRVKSNAKEISVKIIGANGYLYNASLTIKRV